MPTFGLGWREPESRVVYRLGGAVRNTICRRVMKGA